jgi:hypothetical protein
MGRPRELRARHNMPADIDELKFFFHRRETGLRLAA